MKAMKKTSISIFFGVVFWLTDHRTGCLAKEEASNNTEAILLTNSTEIIRLEHKSRIVGGFDAINGRFPYGQVALLSSPKKHQCGGTIVAPDIIMTAAHCAEHINLIKVGEYNRNNDNGQEEEFIRLFRPVKTLIHPLFDKGMFRFYVMLVKLNGRIDDISPVRLNGNSYIPSTSSQSQQQQLLTLIGWGALGYDKDEDGDGNGGGGRRFPDVLQQAHVPYVANRVCENAEYEGRSLYQGEIFNEMLCAGSNGVDACKGDSGSPLILEKANNSPNGNNDDVQVGIVSWGRGCGKYPGVYTRVSKVFHWVRVNLCWHSASPPPYLNCRPFERPNIDIIEEERESELSDAPSMQPSSSTAAAAASDLGDIEKDHDYHGSPKDFVVDSDAPPISDFGFDSGKHNSGCMSQLFAGRVQVILAVLGSTLVLALQ